MKLHYETVTSLLACCLKIISEQIFLVISLLWWNMLESFIRS